MYKVDISVMNRLLAAVLSGAVLLSAGCGSGKTSENTGDAGQQAENTVENDTAGTMGNETGGSEAADDNASDTKNVDGNTAEASETETELSEEELSSPVDFIYRDHPMNLMNEGTKFAMANYYTIDLDKNMGDKFEKLQKCLDDYGAGEEKIANEFFSSSAEEIKEMFDSGWGVAYESDRYFYPVRADGRVFSYIVGHHTYMAGAHGFVDFANYNFNPATGEEIQFSDVVKNTEDLPEVIVNELEKQNEDLAKCFEELPSDRENLINGIPDRYAENAGGLSWAIDYDGIWCYFEDYAMGSYAMGTQIVKIKFADYPEIFTDKYDNYRDRDIPDITKIGRELKEADLVSVDAGPILGNAGSAETDDGTSDDGADPEDGYGEDWWYHAVVKNPGWSAWTAEGIETDAGKPSYELSEVKSNTSDWLNEDKWSEENGIPLPAHFPYEDETYSYSVVNNAEGGEMSLTVFNKELSALEGNFYFDDFINPPDQGEGMFAEFTEPAIEYATVKDSILYVSLGHRTYAAANPHKSYIVAIDMVSGETLWRSDDQVCGSYNFVILGNSIYCGYGFTDEPDYIYILNCKNGKVQKKIKVKSAPYYFIVREEYLYVLTYNTEYLYKIVEG